MALASGVFLLRTSPLIQRHGGLAGPSWSEWVSFHVREKLDDQTESAPARLARLATLLTKYGVCAWGLAHFDLLTPEFWTLYWVVLLVLLLFRKTCQFYAPGKWEHVSIKLDAEHFWLIHLALLGMAESQIPSSLPYGLITLVTFYVMINGESGASLLASFEDVVRVSIGVLALWSLISPGEENVGAIRFFVVMTLFFIGRGAFRATLGRDWLKRRFWWIAQFCFLTSLIVKALAVMNVFSSSHS